MRIQKNKWGPSTLGMGAFEPLVLFEKDNGKDNRERLRERTMTKGNRKKALGRG